MEELKKGLKNYRDISSQRFECLVAVSPTNERVSRSLVWKCQCDCGQVIKTSQRNLVRKYKTNCGCKKQEKYNITGKKYHFLTVIKRIPDQTSYTSRDKWLCRCDCQKIRKVAYFNLVNGHTKSCGCFKKNNKRATFVEETCLDHLNTKLYKNNTSGVKGVYRNKGKWQAYITFKGIRYNLGSYHKLEEATVARKEAEDYFFKSILKKYGKLP